MSVQSISFSRPGTVRFPIRLRKTVSDIRFGGSGSRFPIYLDVQDNSLPMGNYLTDERGALLMDERGNYFVL